MGLDRGGRELPVRGKEGEVIAQLDRGGSSVIDVTRSTPGDPASPVCLIDILGAGPMRESDQIN